MHTSVNGSAAWPFTTIIGRFSGIPEITPHLKLSRKSNVARVLLVEEIMDKRKMSLKITPKKPRNYIAMQMIISGRSQMVMKDRRKSRETKQDWRKEQW
jgi:hypothetical protein